MSTNEFTNKVKSTFAGVNFTKWSTWPAWMKFVVPAAGFLIASQFINPVLLLLGAGIAYFIVSKSKNKDSE